MLVAAADDPTQALVFGELDTQGCFVATRVGPYGLEDIRAAASQATGIPASLREVMVRNSACGCPASRRSNSTPV